MDGCVGKKEKRRGESGGSHPFRVPLILPFASQTTHPTFSVIVSFLPFFAHLLGEELLLFCRTKTGLHWLLSRR